MPKTTVIFTDEFDEWMQSNDNDVQDELYAFIGVLSMMGVATPYPYSSKIEGPSKYKSMRELRTEIKKRAYRILYIFDPKRNAVLLLGGDKSGNKQWYQKNIPKAEAVYEKYLKENNL